MTDNLPIAIIGAGPVGLAAAAHLVERGLTPIILEQAAMVGASLNQWSHVRLFSPWRYNVAAAARRLLEANGWQAPEDDVLPTGGELLRQYLAPLAKLPAIADHLTLSATVFAISREGLDKLSSQAREDSAFVVRYRDATDAEHRIRVRAILDCSGTWRQPNPIGIDGLAVDGETANSNVIDYGLPDVAGARHGDFGGKRILVVGGGHSAINAVLDLIKLQDQAPGTQIFWALRRDNIARLLGGGANDQLPARGALGIAAGAAIKAGRLTMLAPFSVARIAKDDHGLQIEARLDGEDYRLNIDRIVVATGMRPDFSFLRELRVAADPAVEAPPTLAPLIDPNIHSCGSVPPHGVEELTQPETDFYIAGSKSYGRAPTFLMATGYEQVRSITAELAGDHKAAREVHLVLPETGVCSSDPITGELEDKIDGCCGGPAPEYTDACCKRDADVKASGGAGCGCSDTKAPAKVSQMETV